MISPIAVLLQLIDRTLIHHQYPLSVLEFRNELLAKQKQPKILDWAADQLSAMGEHTSSWDWRDRTGMFAISFGIELPILSVAVFLSGLLAIVMKLSTAQAIAVAVVGGVAVAVIGCLVQGGIAGRISGIQICRSRDFAKAGKLRCILRSLLAWSPIITLVACAVYLVIYQINNGSMNFTLNSASTKIDAATYTGADITLLVLSSLAAVFAGILVAVISPARGIQDFLTGTRLVRK